MREPARANELVNWRELPAHERRQWWEQLWLDAIALKDRYRLALRSGWWEDAVAAEAIAAYTAWLAMYDTGALNDPQGKLDLLWALEQLKALLRGGERAFDPVRDRSPYERYLHSVGCHALGDPEPPEDADDHSALASRQRTLSAEMAAIVERLAELGEREHALQAELAADDRRGPDAAQAERDLAELGRTVAQLRRRRRELSRQLDRTDGDR